MASERDTLLEEVKIDDLLALQRTKMAAERTFLSYVRTSLNVLVAGVSFIQFFEMEVFRIMGFLLLPLSMAVFFIGLLRNYMQKKKLNAAREQILRLEHLSKEQSARRKDG